MKHQPGDGEPVEDPWVEWHGRRTEHFGDCSVADRGAMPPLLLAELAGHNQNSPVRSSHPPTGLRLRETRGEWLRLGAFPRARMGECDRPPAAAMPSDRNE
jgi:hypothetical protein